MVPSHVRVGYGITQQLAFQVRATLLATEQIARQRAPALTGPTLAHQSSQSVSALHTVWGADRIRLGVTVPQVTGLGRGRIVRMLMSAMSAPIIVTKKQVAITQSARFSVPAMRAMKETELFARMCV